MLRGDNDTMSAAASVAATRDVLTYLSHYRGRLFVLRIEDDLLGAPLFPMLIKDIVLLQRMGIQYRAGAWRPARHRRGTGQRGRGAGRNGRRHRPASANAASPRRRTWPP